MKVEVYKKPSCPLNIANRGRGPFHRIFSTSSPRHLSVHPLPLVRLHTSNGGGVTLYTTNETKEPQDPSQSPQ